MAGHQMPSESEYDGGGQIMKRSSITSIALMWLLFATCLGDTMGSTISVEDDLGRIVSLHKITKRIVSLAPSTTEILFAIGAGKLVVGADEWSDYPPEARQIPRVGPYMRPNIEKIAMLRPDLIVVASNVIPKNIVTDLEQRLRCPVFVTAPRTVATIFSGIERIGKLVGKAKRAQRLVAQLRKRINKVKQRIRGRKPVPVFVEVAPPPSLMGVGVGNFIDDAIRIAGGENVLKRLHSRSDFPLVSLERLMLLNPRIYVIAAHGSMGREQALSQVRKRIGFNQLSAVRNDRVYAVNADYLFRPGPRIVLGIIELARILHPDAFAQRK